MLKIYGRANSINVRKVLWAADEVGEPFAREDWGRGFRPTSEPEFQKLSPVGVVPVVDDNGFILRESQTIARYLATKHGRADLYPTELKARASCEMFMDWAQTEFAAGMRSVFHGHHLKNPLFSDPKTIAAGVAEWSKQMAILDSHLNTNGPFLLGSAFTLADIPVGLIVNRWFSIAFERPKFDAVAAYYDRLGERKAYRTHGRNGTA